MGHYDEYTSFSLEECFAFVGKYPFANIIKNSAESVPSLISAPIILSENEKDMEFHVAQANPDFENFNAGGNVLAIFNGPNAHISPSWYKNRFADGDRSKTAPTWNYTQVKIQGCITPFDSQDLELHLKRLVTTFESRVTHGWSFDEIDQDFLQKLLPMIKGFKLSVQNVEGIFKLSQEQQAEDRGEIVTELQNRDTGYDAALAEFMKDFAL